MYSIKISLLLIEHTLIWTLFILKQITEIDLRFDKS